MFFSDRRCRWDKSRLDFQQAVTILPARVSLFHPSNSLQYQHDCACALIGVYQKHGHLELQFETLCHHCGWSQPFVKSRCHVLEGHSRVLKLFIAMCHVLSQAFPKTPPVQNIGVSFKLPSGILRGSITLRFFHDLILFFFDRFQTMSSSSHNDPTMAVHIPQTKNTRSMTPASKPRRKQEVEFFSGWVVSLDKACQSTHRLTPPVFKHTTIFSSQSALP